MEAGSAYRDLQCTWARVGSGSWAGVGEQSAGCQLVSSQGSSQRSLQRVFGSSWRVCSQRFSLFPGCLLHYLAWLLIGTSIRTFMKS